MPGNHRDRRSGSADGQQPGYPAPPGGFTAVVDWGNTINKRRFIAALSAAGLLTLTRSAAAMRADTLTWYLGTLLHHLEPEISALTARAVPPDWQPLHACLYFALAGQYLLARQGIATRLKSGCVVYFPTSPLHHRIKPHVWLETASHYIDSAALPRRGYIVVLPLPQIARDPAAIAPGLTKVLILEEHNDSEFSGYVAVHRARVERALQERDPDRD